MSDLATSTNEHRLSVPKEFCEFNSLGANQQKECYHITCRYKRKRVQNSICESDSVPNLDREACFATSSTLSSEKRIHDERAKQRLKTYVAILRNGDLQLSWLKLFFYTFGIAILGFISILPMTLVPVHDLVKFPEYWYEVFLSVTVIANGVGFLNCYLISYFFSVSFTLQIKN